MLSWAIPGRCSGGWSPLSATCNPRSCHVGHRPVTHTVRPHFIRTASREISRWTPRRLRPAPVLLGCPELQSLPPQRSYWFPAGPGAALQTRRGLSRGQLGPRDVHTAEPWAAWSTQARPQDPREGEAMDFQALGGSPRLWKDMPVLARDTGPGGGLSGSPLASEIAFQVRWPGIPRSGHWQYGADGRCGPALACDSPHRSLSGVPSRTDTSEVPTTAMHRRAGALGGLRGKKEPRGPWRRALAGGAGLFAEAHSHWAAERPPPGEGGSTARAVRPGTQTREI